MIFGSRALPFSAKLRRLPIIAEIGVCLVLCNRVAAQETNNSIEFEIEGDVTYDLYDRGNLSQSWSNSFVVSVRGNEWQIETIDSHSNRLIAAKDSRGLTRTLFKNLKPDKEGVPTWVNVGYVHRSDLPTELGKPFLEPLWLTFCSGDYLKASTNGMIEPVWTLDDPNLVNQGFREAAKWDISAAPPNLPENITYLNDGNYRGFDHSSKKSKIVPLPAPYESGYTDAVFHASSFTNVGRLSIPTDFLFRTFYIPMQKGMTADMPRDTLFGHVRTIKLQCADNISLPVYKGAATIWDYNAVENATNGMFPNGYAEYKGNNGQWPGGAQLDAAVYQYARQVAIQKANAVRQAQSEKANKTDVKRKVLIVVFCAALLAPLIFLLSKTIRKRGKQQQK